MTKLWRKPLDTAKWKVPKGEIHLIKERCKGCKFCIELCPLEVLEESEELNERGYHYPKVKEPEKCVNCSYCQSICPEFAIWSTLKEDYD
jgi:2-oxoglutarate ferredoxin oxidoreductase subunit delta